MTSTIPGVSHTTCFLLCHKQCFSRILSIACGPSTFAVSASDTATPSSTSSHRTLTLTSPSLPSHRAAAEMTTLEWKGTVGGGGGGDGGGRGTRGDLPVPGGVYIWDLKSQKMKVKHTVYIHVVGSMECCTFPRSVRCPYLLCLWLSTVCHSTTTATFY